MGSTKLRLWRAYDPDRPHTQDPDFDPLSGVGSSLVSGRWHTARPEIRIVYASEHPALALLELYVNVEHVLHRYTLVEFLIDTPGITKLPDLVAESLYDEKTTRAFGNSWYANDPNPVLEVPSAQVPRGLNYLLRVKDIATLKIINTTTHLLDHRLIERM